MMILVFIVDGIAVLMVSILFFMKSRCGFACGKPEGGCWSRLGHAPIVHSPYKDA